MLYYDASSRPLQPLVEGQVVRMQTFKGHDHLGTVKEVCKEPRSYIITSPTEGPTGEIAATSSPSPNHHHDRSTLQTLIVSMPIQLHQTVPHTHHTHLERPR